MEIERGETALLRMLRSHLEITEKLIVHLSGVVQLDARFRQFYQELEELRHATRQLIERVHASLQD
jgi:hypothetical protein